MFKLNFHNDCCSSPNGVFNLEVSFKQMLASDLVSQTHFHKAFPRSALQKVWLEHSSSQRWRWWVGSFGVGCT